MAQETIKTGLLGLWQAILAISEVAVASHYAAPWGQPALAPRHRAKSPQNSAIPAVAACG